MDTCSRCRLSPCDFLSRPPLLSRASFSSSTPQKRANVTQHFHLLEHPQCVNEQMAFAASHFFAPIIATRIAAHGTRFDRLAVQNGCAWLRLPPKTDAQFSSQGGIDLRPNTSLFPLAERQVDRTPVGQIMGQYAPGTPTTTARTRFR